jgi:Tfp pilus assembly protein PilF
MRHFNMILILQPDNSQAWQNAGYARLKAGDTAGTCLNWQKALDLGDKNVELLIEKYCSK